MCERTSINDAQVSINHVMFSVFNAGFLCAMQVFYVATGSSVCNASLLCSCRDFYLQYMSSVYLMGFLCSSQVLYVANRFSVQPAENLNIFNFEPFRAFKPDFFC